MGYEGLYLMKDRSLTKRTLVSLVYVGAEIMSSRWFGFGIDTVSRVKITKL